MKAPFFTILHKDTHSNARIGQITTEHGVIETPCFVAVGTQASVKGLTPDDLRAIGVQLLFGNTYHLHLRPGEETIKDFGGLAKFMAWNGPTITDSGGFQVFSLGQKKLIDFSSGGVPKSHPDSALPTDTTKEQREDGDEALLVNIKEDGVVFRSHLDGSKHMFTPEVSIQIQKKLGADLMVAFDECAPYPSTKEYTKEAMGRTHRWAERSLQEFKRKETTVLKQHFYGIVQGGIFEDLRVASAQFISNLATDGIAIGGVSVGESKKEMRDVLQWVTPYLPEERPRHLLGIGEIDDIFDAVYYGMDTFDCVIPTRFGRYGVIFVAPQEGSVKNRFRLDITRTVFANDKSPLTALCDCYVCQTFSRAYIHHLFKAGELLGYRLASYHNLYFLVHLTTQIRSAIQTGTFKALRERWLQ